MTNPILGHDINGRPLRAGDEVVLVRPRLGREKMAGMHTKIIRVADDGDMVLAEKNAVIGRNWEAKPESLRKLDNHQSAGSFDEVMAGIKNGQREEV